MNPTLRLRRLVRPASVSAAKSWSATRTCPVVGGVRPPMMWKSVDFPEPDGPTIARNSPRFTVRSTPRIAMMSPLFIGQSLDGVLPGGAQPRVERAQARTGERNQARVEPPAFHNDHGNRGRHKGANGPVGPVAHDDAEHRTADAQDERFGQDDPQDEAAGSAERFENSDLARAL